MPTTLTSQLKLKTQKLQTLNVVLAWHHIQASASQNLWLINSGLGWVGLADIGSAFFNCCISNITWLTHFRHAWTCSQCHQCGGRQPKKVKLFYVSLFMYFKLTYPNFSSSGPGGSGGAVRQRKGAAGGSFLFSFEFYLSH